MVMVQLAQVVLVLVQVQQVQVQRVAKIYRPK
jgi:hypothetical protein